MPTMPTSPKMKCITGLIAIIWGADGRVRKPLTAVKRFSYRGCEFEKGRKINLEDVPDGTNDDLLKFIRQGSCIN